MYSFPKIKAIGIDLGTTNCCVAVFQNNTLEIIKNTYEKNTTPSYITFKQHGIIIGDGAKDQSFKSENTTIYDVKRLIGKKYADTIVQEDINKFSFKVIKEDDKIKVPVQIYGKDLKLLPEQLSALLLSYLRKTAEKKFKTPVTNAVITVPAYFSNSQRQATKLAAKIAGLNVLRIINEPTAAAIAYCHHNIKNAMNTTKSNEKNILVYDLGGGTFDVSIININGKSLKVLAVGGDDHLGGDDFTNNMMDFCIGDFEDKNKMKITDDYRCISRLYRKCEIMKGLLSSSEKTECDLDHFYRNKDLVFMFTRKQFEALNIEEFQRTIDIMKKCIDDAKIDKDKIDKVILSGGSTRIPKVQQLLRDFFNRDIIDHKLNPDEGVAEGAAILADQLQNPKLKHRDMLTLHDVIPKSLGKSVVGGKMSVVMPKNTPIPATKTRNYHTTKDNQTHFKLNIYEGEDELVEKNNLLGKFVIDKIRSGRKGEVEHLVTFNVDVNGILSVTSKDNRTKTEMMITIDDSSTSSDDEVQCMKQEIEQLTHFIA